MSADFFNQIRTFANQIEASSQKILTEEATETSLIMPFFQLLGYDVFDPSEFVPEFIADQGIKKGEKVDYAIMIDGTPAILIEAKSIDAPLNVNYESQLFRYFTATRARFAILTNGIEYKFYTDLDAPNVMDKEYFLCVNLLDASDTQLNELKKFTRENFDPDNILSSAEKLKYGNMIISLLNNETKSPSEGFIQYVLNEIYDGVKTKQVKEHFYEIIKNALKQFINEKISEKLKAAFDSSDTDNTQSDEEQIDLSPVSKITTTDYELEAFYIIKAILRTEVPSEDICCKDTQSYFGILYKNNTRKWICRFYLEGSKKFFIYPDENKKELKQQLESLDDIYKYRDIFVSVVKRYI